MTAAVRSAPGVAKSMAWGPLAGASVTVAGIALAQRPWDGGRLTLTFTRVAAALLAAAAAFALDDRAARTVAASPTLRWQRQVTRGGLAAVVAALAALVVCAGLAVAGGARGFPLARVMFEGGAMVLLSFACATIAGADRGPLVFLAALFMAGLVQQRWPAYSLFALAPGAPGWTGSLVAWMLIAFASAVVVAAAWRDPVTGTSPIR